MSRSSWAHIIDIKFVFSFVSFHVSEDKPTEPKTDEEKEWLLGWMRITDFYNGHAARGIYVC